MRLKTCLMTAAFALSLGLAPAFAGPVRDAEAKIADAYGDYRAALYLTNQKKKAETEAALTAFKTKWTALTTAWRTTPPPQYADDGKLGETLDTVAKLTDEATKLANAGDLAKSHDVLEGIRDALGALRARNGIITFSDRMNAYHSVMEHVYDHKYDSPAAMGEDVAVLAYLIKEIGENRPAGVDAAAYDPLFKAMEGSVAALKAAIKGGDAAAIDTARKAIKPAYSRLFLKFG